MGIPFPEQVTPGGILVYPQVQSPNFVSGSSGWQIARNGSAEFNNVTVRGSIVDSGSGGVFLYNGIPALGNSPVISMTQATTDPFGNTTLPGFKDGRYAIVNASGDTSGVTDWTNITNAMGECNEVLLSGRGYFVNQPLAIPSWVTLRGTGSATNNSFVQPGSQTTINAATGFSAGSSPAPGIISLAGSPSSTIGGQQIRNLVIDGQSGPAGIDGISAYSNVYGVIIEDVATYRVTGRGLACVYDGVSGQPDGWRIRGLMCSQSVSYGAYFQAADMIIEQMACIGGQTDGWLINNLANSVLAGCRAQNSGGNGWHFSWANGGTSGYLLMNGCASDQNKDNGWFFDSTTTTMPVMLNGCASNTDGQAGGAQTGIVIVNTCDLTVMISGWGSTANGTGPATGASLTGGGYVSVANALFAATTTPVGGNPSNWRAMATKTGSGAITQVADSA